MGRFWWRLELSLDCGEVPPPRPIWRKVLETFDLDPDFD
jgi:hypothetical protein